MNKSPNKLPSNKFLIVADNILPAVFLTLAVAGIFFLAQFLSVVVMSVVLSIGGLSDSEIAASITSRVGRFTLAVLIASVTFLLVKLMVKKLGLSWRQIGFGAYKHSAWWVALIGFGGYWLITLTLTAILTALVPSINIDQEQIIGFDKTASSVGLLLTFLSLVILPALVEEMLFRGLLYSSLRNFVGVVWAGLVVSILFGLAHMQFGSGEPLLWVAAVDTFALSLVLVYIRESRKSIWPAILLHGMKNSLAFIFLFLLK